MKKKPSSRSRFHRGGPGVAILNASEFVEQGQNAKLELIRCCRNLTRLQPPVLDPIRKHNESGDKNQPCSPTQLRKWARQNRNANRKSAIAAPAPTALPEAWSKGSSNCKRARFRKCGQLGRLATPTANDASKGHSSGWSASRWPLSPTRLLKRARLCDFRCPDRGAQ